MVHGSRNEAQAPRTHPDLPAKGGGRSPSASLGRIARNVLQRRTAFRASCVAASGTMAATEDRMLRDRAP